MKFIDASCQNNQVTADGKVVPAEILSQGKKSSTGVMLMDEDKRAYLTSNATDIADLITKLESLVQLISDTFSAIGSGMTGPTTAPPGSLPTSITQLATIKSQLDTMKVNLK